jgi:hypothetical protein
MSHPVTSQPVHTAIGVSEIALQFVRICYRSRSPQDIINNLVQPFRSQSTPKMHFPLFSLAWSTRILWYTGLEAVGELSSDGLEVTHASGAGGLPPLGLLAPVVCFPRVSENSLLALIRTTYTFGP